MKPKRKKKQGVKRIGSEPRRKWRNERVKVSAPWFKIRTADIIDNMVGFTDKEQLLIIKMMALYMDKERIPTDKEIYQYGAPKTYRSIQRKLALISDYSSGGPEERQRTPKDMLTDVYRSLIDYTKERDRVRRKQAKLRINEKEKNK